MKDTHYYIDKLRPFREHNVVVKHSRVNKKASNILITTCHEWILSCSERERVLFLVGEKYTAFE